MQGEGKGERKSRDRKRREDPSYTKSFRPVMWNGQTKTGLSSQQECLMRVLNSSALPAINFPSVLPLFCSKWWELRDHKHSKLTTNNPS